MLLSFMSRRRPRGAWRQYWLVVFSIVIIVLYLSVPRADDWHKTLHDFHPQIQASPWARRAERYPVTKLKRLPQGPPLPLLKIQYNFRGESRDARKLRESRLQTIKDNFAHAWEGYKTHAWLRDELKPISGGPRESFGNWSATLVDTLDTLWIMGFYDDFEEAVSAVSAIDFETSTSDTISVFETTIRYLGGLLSAYDLSGNTVLLKKAWELGNILYAAFDTPSRMPVPYWSLKNALEGGTQDTDLRAASANIGSLGLEFTRLSQLTGDPKFFDAVQRISDVLLQSQNKTALPGLWPTFINAQTQDFESGNDFSLGALADSLYEYLPKTYMLLGGLGPEYGQMYQTFMDAAERSMFYRIMNPQNRTLMMPGIAHVTNTRVNLETSGQHLACFVAGMVAIGAKIFDREADLEVAKSLADGCVWAYESMPSGIMPEIMSAVPCPESGDCTWNEQTWFDAVLARAHLGPDSSAEQLIQKRHLPAGFTGIQDGKYILRPEAIESVFILYRITGDVEWQNKAWRMWTAIETATRTPHAHAALRDVSVKVPEQVDEMESFWTAETLKYFFLIFADPDVVSLDEYVLNTEAHPLRLPKARTNWSI